MKYLFEVRMRPGYAAEQYAEAWGYARARSFNEAPEPAALDYIGKQESRVS